jgi:hypothetical protein
MLFDVEHGRTPRPTQGGAGGNRRGDVGKETAPRNRRGRDREDQVGVCYNFYFSQGGGGGEDPAVGLSFRRATLP